MVAGAAGFRAGAAHLGEARVRVSADTGIAGLSKLSPLISQQIYRPRSGTYISVPRIPLYTHTSFDTSAVIVVYWSVFAPGVF